MTDGSKYQSTSLLRATGVFSPLCAMIILTGRPCANRQYQPLARGGWENFRAEAPIETPPLTS